MISGIVFTDKENFNDLNVYVGKDGDVSFDVNNHSEVVCLSKSDIEMLFEILKERI